MNSLSGNGEPDNSLVSCDDSLSESLVEDTEDF